MAIFDERSQLYVNFSGSRCQDTIPLSLANIHVIRMRLFDIFVEMGADFGPLGLKNGHF